MTGAPVLPFRGTNCFFGFFGSWRRAFVSPQAPTCKIGHAGSRHPVYAYALATCFVFGLCSPVAAQSSVMEKSFIRSELAATPDTQKSTAEILEAQAYIWMQRGRADKAAEVWRKLLLSQPKHTTALSELAVHAATVGALAEAQRRLRELQEADPQDGRLVFVRAILRGGDQVAAELREARLLSKSGHPQEALRHYWKAFGETEPTTLSGLEYYQVLAAAPDGWDAAHAGLERLAELYPKAAHVQLALALHLTYVDSTRTRGISLLQQLAGTPTVSNQAHAGWRRAVIWLGDSPQALQCLQDYVSANPQDNELRRRLEQLKPRLEQQEALRQAFQALKAGELDQAEEKFQSILGAESDTETLVGLASVALAREDFDKAAELLYQVRELAPERPELWQPLLLTAELWQAIKRADKLRREGRLDEAQALLEHAATSASAERYQAVLALDEVLLDRGDLSRAQHNLQELMTEPPTDTAGLRRLVSLLLRANLDEQAAVANEALRDIDASAAFSPEDLRAEQSRLRAIHLRQAGDVIAARDTLVAAAGLDPRASQVWLDLMNLDLELGELDEAQRSVKALLAAEPGLPEAVLAEARIAEQRGEYERSLELLSTIAAPASSGEIDNLRRRLEVRLAAEKAVRTFRIGGVSAARMQLSGLERAAPSPTNLAIVAEAWADIGEVDHAILLLHAGDTASAEVPGVQLQIAALLLRAGRTSEAMAVLDELAAQPGLASAELFALQKLRIGCAVRVSDSLRSQGDLAGARSELAPWTGARPLDPQIANAYGRVLHDAGDYVAAAGQFDLVLKRDPGNLDALQGLTYAALGGGVDLAKAHKALRQGLQVRGGDPRLHLFIARLDAKSESYTAALKELAQANSLVEDEMRFDATLTSKDKTITRQPSQTQQPEGELEHLRSDIQSETQRIRSVTGIKIKPDITMRSRQGEPGRDALFELKAPSRLELPNPWGTLSLQVTPTHLSAGRLVFDNGPDTLFGTVKGTVGPRDIEADGVALGVGYGHRGWQLDLGVTPVKFACLNIVGGLCWKRAFRDITLTLEASRRPVEESVLSFAGVSDPGTGRVWGGVVKQGGAVTLSYDGHNSRSYAVLDYNYLTGTNVESNHSLAAHLGIRWELQSPKSMRLETGITVSAMAFERNLSKFTYGHGGYFSPQRFLHCGLPIDWQGSYQAITWQLTFEPGVTWFQMDEAPYYPLAVSAQMSEPKAWYPSRKSLGLGVDGGLELGYVLTPQMTLGARAELHTGDDYREICAVTFLRFALKGGD
ncbi:MAG: cellulose synthase subunit BcsC-related outer membrane protein [Bacillota bacterium]|nr:cellulose synthase subunit BcsC-related outer membrane protein [Bacillota bacterium]